MATAAIAEEVEQRLLDQEKLVVRTKEKLKDLKETSDGSEDTLERIEELQEKLEERTTLLHALAVNLTTFRKMRERSEKHGFLFYKRPRPDVEGWKFQKFYFMLSSRRFFYYASEATTEKPLGTIPLTVDCDVVPDPVNKMKFKIVNRYPTSEESEHEFMSLSETDAWDWIKALNSVTGGTIGFNTATPMGQQAQGAQLQRVPSRERETPIKLTRRASMGSTWGKSLLQGSQDRKKSFGTKKISKFLNRSKLVAMRSTYGSVCLNAVEFKRRFDFSEHCVTAFNETTEVHILRGGTMRDVLAWCLLHSEREEEDNADLQALALSYKSYATMAEVVATLKDVWEYLVSHTYPDIIPTAPEKLRQLLFNFTKQWLLSEVIDFDASACEADRHLLKDFAKSCLEEDTPLASTLVSISLLPRNRASSSEESGVSTKQSSPFPGITFHGNESTSNDRSDDETSENSDLEAMSYDSDSLAAQLTLIESELFQRITAKELLDLAWQKHKDKAQFALTALSTHFNKVANWVSSCVLQPDDVKQQLSIIKKFIRVAKRLHELRNYNTCIQVLFGLNNITVKRLRRFKETPLAARVLEKFTRLNEIYSTENNYSGVRQLPKDAPCIPVLAVTLRDLTHIYDGVPKYLDEGAKVINMDRVVQLNGSIQSVVSKSTARYNITMDSLLYSMLKEIAPLSEKELYARSLELEPFRATTKKKPTEDKKAISALQKETANVKERVKSMELQGTEKLIVDMVDGLPCDTKEVTPQQMSQVLCQLQLLSVSFVEMRRENAAAQKKLEEQLEEKKRAVDQLMMENESLFASIIDLQQRVADLESLAVAEAAVAEAEAAISAEVSADATAVDA